MEAEVGLRVIDSNVSEPEPVPVPDTGIESERDSAVSVSLFSFLSFINTLPLNVALDVGMNLTTKLALSPGVRVIGIDGVLMVKPAPLTVALSTTKLPAAVGCDGQCQSRTAAHGDVAETEAWRGDALAKADVLAEDQKRNRQNNRENVRNWGSVFHIRTFSSD